MSEAEKPSEAAMRAAKEVNHFVFPGTHRLNEPDVAAIIDRETGLAEKEAALRQISGMSAHWADAGKGLLKEKLRKIDVLARAALTQGATP